MSYSIHFVGAPANLGIFTNSPASSTFAQGETREDEIYSPYSPYGDGSASTYNNNRKGTDGEKAFYQGVFAESQKRVANIPSYTAKKAWFETTTELTRYMYNTRTAMNYLAKYSSNPKAADAAAKSYYQDLNDMFVFSKQKNADKVNAAYEKSVSDLATFKSLI